MKSIPANLLKAYQRPAQTIAHFLRITRRDGLTLGFAALDRDVLIDGVLYRARPGLTVQALVTSASLDVENLELTVLTDDPDVVVADVRAGLWDNAEFVLFEADYDNVTFGANVLQRGRMGQARPRGPDIVFELRGLKALLAQAQGEVTSKTCRATLGDARCTVDLAPYTETGTLTAVTSRMVFADSGRAEADDWFVEGVLTFTSGANAGTSHKVRLFAAGQFTLTLPCVFNPEVGDTYEVIAGCQRRLEDCRDKFDNVVNFQGEPHLPGIDELTSNA